MMPPPAMSIDRRGDPPVVVVRADARSDVSLVRNDLERLVEEGFRLFVVHCHTPSPNHLTSRQVEILQLTMGRLTTPGPRVPAYRLAVAGFAGGLGVPLERMILGPEARTVPFCSSLDQALEVLRNEGRDRPPEAGNPVPRPTRPPSREAAAEIDPGSQAERD
jgi:hypothetical protein